MPMPRKPTPERYCKACGKRLERKRMGNGRLESLLHFNRRPYCDRECMKAAFRAKSKKQDPSWMTAHYHARNLKPPGPCERCGKPNGSDVHHKNGDWRDNSPENLERLCRSCHSRAHRPRASCSICGKPAKGYGYCDKHYQRFKKWGDPLMVKRNQHTPVERMAE